MAPNKPIFLLDQMDAVEARDKNWPRPPFELNQDDKSDYGQGSIDNKLSITRLSPTLICFKKEGFVPYWDYSRFLAFLGDEETNI